MPARPADKICEMYCNPAALSMHSRRGIDLTCEKYCNPLFFVFESHSSEGIPVRQIDRELQANK